MWMSMSKLSSKVWGIKQEVRWELSCLPSLSKLDCINVGGKLLATKPEVLSLRERDALFQAMFN